MTCIQSMQPRPEEAVRPIEKLVEYRTAHYSAHSEAANYFTNTPARVHFRFSNPIICRLTQGFKVMRIGGGSPFAFHVGDVMYVPQDTTIDVDLSAASSASPIECDCFEIETVRLEEIIGRLNESLAVRGDDVGLLMDWNRHVVIPAEEAETLRLAHLMRLFRDRDNIFADVRIETGINETLLALLQNRSGELLLTNPDAIPGNGINAAARLIRQNLHRHIANEELARVACMSVSTLHRQFLRHFGQTPARFAQRLRIAEARQALKQRRVSIEDVVERLGFSSPSHFSRVFHQYTGETPAAYRRQRLSPDVRIWEYCARN